MGFFVEGILSIDFSGVWSTCNPLRLYPFKGFSIVTIGKRRDYGIMGLWDYGIMGLWDYRIMGFLL